MNIVAKMVVFNFDSENVFKASALGTVLTHSHVISDHVASGASGVNEVLVLPHAKLVPNSEFVNVKTLHNIPVKSLFEQRCESPTALKNKLKIKFVGDVITTCTGLACTFSCANPNDELSSP